MRCYKIIFEKGGEIKMRITELLDRRSICLDGAPTSKGEALDQVVDLMAKSGKRR